MEKLLVSACLLGASCRYDGKSVSFEAALKLGKSFEIIPFCPEIYGGLPTPRVPCEIVGDRVVNKDGEDKTSNYKKGATEALRLCHAMGIKKALLKEKSPSCGKGQVYDGTFSGKLVEGGGITARFLAENGIEVFGESELPNI